IIVMALGLLLAQLQRVNDALADRAPRTAPPSDTFEPSATRGPASRVPFPSRPKVEADSPKPEVTEAHGEPEPANTAGQEAPRASPFAPMLRNPEESPVTVDDDVSLSPQHPMAARGSAQPGIEETHEPPRFEPKLDTAWRPPAQPSRQPPPMQFESMWPNPAPAKEPPASEIKAEPARAGQPPQRPQPDVPAPNETSEQGGTAILKSGVVDGMGYTLYVDGSIEAELPQGTLRFASINELRAHLEKNT